MRQNLYAITIVFKKQKTTNKVIPIDVIELSCPFSGLEASDKEGKKRQERDEKAAHAIPAVVTSCCCVH